MRIGLIHRDLHAVTRGGICTLYRELAPRLRDLSHHVTLITQDTAHPITLPGVDLVTLPRADDLDAHRHAVAQAVDQLGCDVVECSSWEAELLHYLRRPSGERAPAAVRGDLSAATMQAWALVTHERELLARADVVLAVSSFAARDLADAYGIPPAVVVPNGVDRNRFRPVPAHRPLSGYQVTIDGAGAVVSRTPLAELAERDEPPPPWGRWDGLPSVVWVGKVTPMKGWDRLEALLPRLRGRANLTILLGHSRAYCPVTITGEHDVVIVQDLGDDDMAGFYSAADFLLSTSRWEGFGLAIAEAVACGTPALLPAQLGTATELLADGGGHLYADDEELLDLLISAPTVTSQPSVRFDWDANAAATVAVYDTLAESGQPCASC